jgi:hypothetical protein
MAASVIAASEVNCDILMGMCFPYSVIISSLGGVFANSVVMGSSDSVVIDVAEGVGGATATLMPPPMDMPPPIANGI